MKNLGPAERSHFSVMLRRLAERHELLPDRMVIKEELEVSDEILASGGFGDVRSGTYMGGRVAVKTARIAARDNLQQIRKVSINGIFASTWARFQLFHPSDFTGRSPSGKRYPIRTS